MTQNPQTAVITAHGQPSAPAPAEAELAKLAADAAAFLPEWEVRSATLATPGRLEEMTEDGAVVYPFFMSQGYFTAKVLPVRLKGVNCRIAAPFGLDSALPPLAARAIQQATLAQGWDLGGLHLLLAAHGSARGPKAAEAAEAFAARLRPLLPGCTITSGYVEQDPRIETASAPLPARTLCLPFFAQSGDHVKEDIPKALKAAQFGGPVLPVTGALPGVPELIAKAIRSTASDCEP